MHTSAFTTTTPISLSNRHQPSLKCRRCTCHSRPARRPRPPHPTASVQPSEQEEKDVPPNKKNNSGKQLPNDVPGPTASGERNEGGASTLFMRDLQRVRQAFENMNNNNNHNHSSPSQPSPVRSGLLKQILSRIMRVQAVIEQVSTEQLPLFSALPRFRRPSEPLPGSATRRFMRLFSFASSYADKDKWTTLGYFQWQKVSPQLPPSEARRTQRKQRRNMLDGIAENYYSANNPWRTALSAGGKAIDAVIQSSIDGARRHNQASDRLRQRNNNNNKQGRIRKKNKLRRKEMHKNININNITHQSDNGNNNNKNDGSNRASGSSRPTANGRQTFEEAKFNTTPLNAFNSADVNESINMNTNNIRPPFADLKEANHINDNNYNTTTKRKKYSYGNSTFATNAVKLAQSFVNPIAKKSKGMRQNEKGMENADKHNNNNNNITISSGESMVAEAVVNFGQGVIGTKKEGKGKKNKNNMKEGSGFMRPSNKWTLDSYETRLFFVVMGALAAKSLIITITPIVTLVSHAYIISEAQTARKMPRDMLNNYIRRKSRAMLGIEYHLVRNYRLLPNSNNNNSIINTEDEVYQAVDTVARQVGMSTPAILNAPVVGEVLQGVDSVAYSAENMWKRMAKIVGMRQSVEWENDKWILLESLEWQRSSNNNYRGNREA